MKKKIVGLIAFCLLLIVAFIAFQYWSARNPDSYIGMTEKSATSRAEKYDIDYRIVRRDKETFAVTMDYRPDRLNFEIDKGIVSKAYGG